MVSTSPRMRRLAERAPALQVQVSSEALGDDGVAVHLGVANCRRGVFDTTDHELHAESLGDRGTSEGENGRRAMKPVTTRAHESGRWPPAEERGMQEAARSERVSAPGSGQVVRECGRAV